MTRCRCGRTLVVAFGMCAPCVDSWPEPLPGLRRHVDPRHVQATGQVLGTLAGIVLALAVGVAIAASLGCQRGRGTACPRGASAQTSGSPGGAPAPECDARRTP